MNTSLSKFTSLSKRLLFIGAVFLGVGVGFAVLNTPSAGTFWSDGISNFNTQMDCETASDAPQNCVLTNQISGNGNLMTFGYELSGVGAALVAIGIISGLLVMTSKSIVEGMGGNITTKSIKTEEYPYPPQG